MKAFACFMGQGDDSVEFIVLARSLQEAVENIGGKYNERNRTVQIAETFLHLLGPQDEEWEKLQPEPGEKPLVVYEKGRTRIVLPFSDMDKVILFIKEVPLLGESIGGNIGAPV